MKTILTILGCGSSMGVPRADGFWGLCNNKNKKNYRTRSSALISKGNNIILIDTSPDLRFQFLKNKINNISSVLYTLQHADHTHGINDLRPFYLKDKKKINIYANKMTLNYLKNNFSYYFKNNLGYPSILTANKLKKNFSLGFGKELIKFETIKVKHGNINSVGYLFNDSAYISDCSKISKTNIVKLKNLKYFIIDCLSFKPHVSHLSLNEVLGILKDIKPKKTILTNLHSDMDYNILLKKLPINVKPAFDGLKIQL